MLRRIQYQLAKSLNHPIDGKGDFRVQAMLSDIQRLGGSLKFIVKKTNEGWLAECENLKGIITGGANSLPTEKEMNSQIKDAVFTAFGIPPYLCRENLLRNVANEPIVIEEERVYA